MDQERGGFCQTPFWDEDATWNTTDPDFTPCFQKTFLLWLPSALLVIGAPFRFYSLTRNKTESIPFTWLNILKTILAVLIAVITVADISKTIHEYATGAVVPTVNFISPLVLCLTMVLVVILIHHERKQGVHSSGFLFIFWLLLFFDSILVFQSKVRDAVTEGAVSDIFRFVTFMLFFPLVITELILSAFVDKHPSVLLIQDKNACPENNSSVLSRITFWWFSSLVVQGYKRALVRDDLWSLNEEDKSSTVVPKFEKHWDCEVAKSKRNRNRNTRDTPIVDGTEMRTINQDGQTYAEVPVNEGKKCQASLFTGLTKTYGPLFLLSALYKLLFDIMQFLAPILLKFLIQFTKNKMEYYWRGFFYAALMFVNATLQSLILHQYFHGCQLLGMRMRTSLIASVYKKTINLSNAARKLSTVGEIVNLMSVDAQRFMDLMTYLHMIWSGPFQIIISIYLLYDTLGYSIFAGVAIMIILIPINAAIAKKTRDYQAKQMRLKDQRIKLMNEILNGMKVLKLYAWESSFEKQVLELRKKELSVLKRLAYLNACVSFTWTTAPYVVSLVTFAVYVLSDPNNILDAEKAFVSLSLFNILRFPLSMLPQVISSLVQANVSLKRLEKFLNHEELDSSAVQHDISAKHAISMENCTVTWDHETVSTLRNINLQIPDGSLVAIVGAVGSGKSSMLSAMLGEMEKVSGSVNVKGSVAYVAQQAWIQNATVQDNILFGKSKNQVEYESIIEGCALKTDLEILPAGDQTEIGEKGINLSGGQKQRVSLARACYQDADVYLLDDPLSAVDSHVGRHIFDNIVGPNGLLKDKISEYGSYKQLLSHNGAFAEFLRNYLTEELENDELEADLDDIGVAEDIVSQLGSVMGDEKAKKLQKQVSVISSRIRTMSGGSSENITQKSGSVTSLTKSLGSNGPGTPSLKSKSDHSHHKKDDGVAENMIKQVEEKKKEDKLIKAESVETGSVKYTVFLSYLKSVGPILSPCIMLFYILYNVTSVYSNFWLSDWSNDNVTVTNGTIDTAQRDLRLGVYGALGFIQGFFAVFASIALYVGNVLAGKKLHAGILKNTLASSMTFFDTTPQGRIMNRFSKDIDVIDTIIPRVFESWWACLLKVISVPVVIGLRIFIVMASIALYVGNVWAGMKLHAGLLKNILASSMNFFDTTPQGRIMNRFSKDIDVLDTILARIYESWWACLLRVISVPVVIGLSTPLFLTIILPIAILYIAVQDSFCW
ncbi:hypothetical protein KUTeg_004453 [Tegillarca granosa]|uniref:ABC-type glutathione-S-conjugate transporter n=1 Tax=Tegillarca granosa TaxID=220873 RepID=A0ABQ9FTP5_TEGGR|nr:hypothetical protein KUTeg_004453 [Tegillarca granosa]